MFPVLLDREIWFPHPEHADSTGLLALGGDLSVKRLLLAYSSGIFPWFSPGDPILWWSPDPRMVLFPNDFHVPKRLARTIRKGTFHITMDMDFSGVIEACASAGNRSREGTWITEEMVEAYTELHKRGVAHSVEAWLDGKLVGGLYGVCIGRVFFGESMFHKVADASKVAFAVLVGWLSSRGVDLIDCQVRTQHLARFGAREISRKEFVELVAMLCHRSGPATGSWSID